MWCTHITVWALPVWLCYCSFPPRKKEQEKEGKEEEEEEKEEAERWNRRDSKFNDTYAIMKEYRKALQAQFPSLTKFQSSQMLSLAGL